MEIGMVSISRAALTVTYTAVFKLLVLYTLCPCGYLGTKHFYCSCTPKRVAVYKLLDRMDILLKLDTVSLEDESIRKMKHQI